MCQFTNLTIIFFFSPDNDLKRPLATVILCTTTHTESVKFCVYILPRNLVELSTLFPKRLEKKGHVADNSNI